MKGGQQEGLSGEIRGVDSLSVDESGSPETDSEAETLVINGIRVNAGSVIYNHLNSRK